MLQSVRPLTLLPGFGLMALFIGFEAIASSRILAALGSPIPARRCYTYSMMGFCCASITPSSSGGQPAQIYVITLIQGILMLTMQEEDFNAKYVDNEKTFPLF